MSIRPGSEPAFPRQLTQIENPHARRAVEGRCSVSDIVHDIAAYQTTCSVYSRDWQANRLLAEARDEIIRLREIVKRLPRTADGVPIVPEMAYYYKSPAGIMATTVDSWSELDDVEERQGNIFSTREAAEKAKEMKP